MSAPSQRTLVAVVFVLAVASVANAQETTNDAPRADEVKYVGEVTGNRVYVRSGPDANYYPVTQLDAGARVQVVGEAYGWLEIVPPAGCHSLIHKTYVDRGTGELGVVNGDAVWVRTGSDVSDGKYAKQFKLDRGAEVTVLGEADGYYKIKPPPGAHVYISSTYVQRVPPERLAATGARESEAAGAPAAEKGEAVLTAAGGTPPAAPAIDYRAAIDAIEDQLAAELAKPIAEQSFAGVIEQFKPIAETAGDDAMRMYASHRIEQLRHRQETLRLYGFVEKGAGRLAADVREIQEARAALQLSLPPPQPRFDITGEFRKSMIFNSPVLPRRYLLVDPSSSPARTIAYVEIPEDSPINPNLYLGRFVGVVAEKRFYHRGGVEAIEVFVPREIVILTEPAITGERELGEPPAPANVPISAEPETEIP